MTAIPSWDLAHLKNRVRKSYGEEQVDQLRPSLNALGWKLPMACYHAYESMRVVDEVLEQNNDVNEIIGATRLILEQASGSELGQEFAIARFQQEAHVIAHAQALHSTADILGQVIYHALNLGERCGTVIEEHRRSIYSVRNLLQKDSALLELAALVDKLITAPEFRYLNAYTNITKHRSLVDSTYEVSFVDNEQGHLIREFEYDEEVFAAKRSSSFVKDNLFCLNKMIVGIGQKTSEILDNEM